jgi:hypothetical protein
MFQSGNLTLHLSLPGTLGNGISSKVFVVRAAKATTSNPLYKCFTAWKDVRVPFSIKGEGTI